MKYKVNYSDDALKDLKKIDKHQVRIILGWIEKNLIDCDDPRRHGKSLKHNRCDEWSYRVGTYRLLADIQDDVITIEIINVGHRRDVYK